MTHSPAEIVANLLAMLGLGTLPTLSPLGAWPIYPANEPDKPDDCVTVYDTQGTEDGRSMIDGALWAHFGVQVRIRASDHPTGRAKAEALRDAMSKTVYHNSVSLDGSRYLVWCLARIGQVIPLHADKPRTIRNLFTINATAAITPR